MIQKEYLNCLVILLLFLGACNNKNPLKNESKIETNNRIRYEMIFPDTVIIGKEYFGLINYNSTLDSVTTKFGVKGKNRYVRLIMTTTETVDYDYKYLKSIVKDTFGAYDNRTIDFLLKFEKLGTTYIDGLINDVVLIDLEEKNSNGEEMIRWIEDEVRVTKKVVVIDKE